MSYHEAVAANVDAAVREALGRTIADIAKASGLSLTALNRMRKGERLTVANIGALATGLGIPVEALTSTETDAARAALETQT